MEEKILKEILDVVIDIKADQKVMKNEMNDMKAEMNGKIDDLATKVDKLSAEQVIMKEEIRAIKTDVKLLNFNVNILMKEQEDTKFAVCASVQKIGEVSDKLDRYIRENDRRIV